MGGGGRRWGGWGGGRGGMVWGEEGTGVANRETEEQEEKMEIACPEYI